MAAAGYLIHFRGGYTDASGAALTAFIDGLEAAPFGWVASGNPVIRTVVGEQRVWLDFDMADISFRVAGEVASIYAIIYTAAVDIEALKLHARNTFGLKRVSLETGDEYLIFHVDRTML